MRYRGFEITSCPDSGVERYNRERGRNVICNGYYCQVYAGDDDQQSCQLDDFCLAKGYEIKDCSDEEVEKGIIKYVDDHFNALCDARLEENESELIKFASQM